MGGGESPVAGRQRVRGREWLAARADATMRGVLRRTLIVFALSLVAAAPACAGDIVVKLSFAPGKLVVRAPAAAALPDRPVRVDVTVADGRGSGAGWTLRVASPRPVTVTSITARCAAGSTCTLPRAAAGPSGTTVMRSARDTGMGVLVLSVTIAALPNGAAPAALAFRAS